MEESFKYLYFYLAIKKKGNIVFVSFTLYPSYSMVGRGNLHLVLRLSVSTFRRYSLFARYCVLSGRIINHNEQKIVHSNEI